MLIYGILLAFASGVAAFALTALVRRSAEKLGLVQAPNHRSSHKQPTPSGGGVGIVLGGTVASALVAIQSPWPYLALAVLAVIVAAIGLVDDRRPIPARYRLGAQLVLLALAIAAIPLERIAASIGLALPVPMLAIVLVFAAAYWLNLFNFMDGIDGLAASQAVFMSAAAALLAWLHVPAAIEAPMFWWLVGIGVACLGFLLLNWPPAKIFMGDAGSTYLGYVLAIIAFLTIAEGWLTLPQWLIIGAAFVSDATVTLARRLALREKVFEAHRRHAYQVLSRRWNHQRVTLLFIAINVVWLLPMAALAGATPAWQWPLVVVAYLPLLAGAFRAGAGAPEAA